MAVAAHLDLRRVLFGCSLESQQVLVRPVLVQPPSQIE